MSVLVEGKSVWLRFLEERRKVRIRDIKACAITRQGTHTLVMLKNGTDIFLEKKDYSAVSRVIREYKAK